jgi:hypothetical protein
MLITEEELREIWQNGRGSLPPFPMDVRFTPSAHDFLTVHRLQVVVSATEDFIPVHTGDTPVRRLEARPMIRRMIYTERDIEDLIQQGQIALELGENDVVTELARDRADKAGLAIRAPQPARRGSLTPPQMPSHNAVLLPTPPTVAPQKEAHVAKKFYTDLDIEDLSRQGVTSLTVNNDVVLTDLAREKAGRLGIQLASGTGSTPEPQSDLFQQVKKAVLARLINPVDEKLVDEVVRQVLAGLDLK